MTGSLALFAAILTHCADDGRSCESLSDEAATRRNEIEAIAENRSCSSDADCLGVYHRLRCFKDCGQPAPVSRASAERVASDISAVEDELCGQRERQDCSASSPAVPCGGALDPSLFTPVCRNNQCELDYPQVD